MPKFTHTHTADTYVHRRRNEYIKKRNYLCRPWVPRGQELINASTLFDRLTSVSAHLHIPNRVCSKYTCRFLPVVVLCY